MDKVLIMSEDDLKNAIKNTVDEVVRKVKDEKQKPEFVTIKQACEILGASRGSIYNWTKMGLLKIHTIAGSKRFKFSEILDAPKKIKRYERRPTSWKDVASSSTGGHHNMQKHNSLTYADGLKQKRILIIRNSSLTRSAYLLTTNGLNS